VPPGCPRGFASVFSVPSVGRQGARKATFFRRAGTRMRCSSLLLKKFLSVSVAAPRHGRSERIGRFRPLMKKHAPFAVLEFPNGTSQRVFIFFIEQNIRDKDDVIGQRMDFKPDDFRFHRPKSVLSQEIRFIPNPSGTAELEKIIRKQPVDFFRRRPGLPASTKGFPKRRYGLSMPQGFPFQSSRQFFKIITKSCVHVG